MNAIVAKLDDDECLALADAADARLARGGELPPLHGLPTAFKDLQSAVGFKFTRGSPIYKDAMPTEDSVFVERLRRAGVIPIGKTNVPEFGMGSHTYNKVYGTTLNPYDVTKSAGGSSGGAGAALATGMLPIADGSDLGGSLRNPGNFNNIVGFRPSVGLTPTWPTSFPLLGFSVNGPLARTVADIALLMSVMTGPDPRDPSLLPADPAVFRGALERDFRGVRVAWCPDLGGLPLDRRVRAVLDAQRKTFEDLGCIVEEAAPDLADADSVFLTIRAFRSAATYGPLLDAVPRLAEARGHRRGRARPVVDHGRRCAGDGAARAAARPHAPLRGALCVHALRRQSDPAVRCGHRLAERDRRRRDGALHRVAEVVLLDHGDLPPRDLGAGGLHAGGLPVGIQIVGRYRDDFGVLQLGHAFEQSDERSAAATGDRRGVTRLRKTMLRISARAARCRRLRRESPR